MSKVVIIDYGAGNMMSVKFALQRLGLNPLVSRNFEEINSAEKVIFPGVGEAKSAMDTLYAYGLDKVITELQQPVLGVCLGMQLLCESSEERETKGLGVIPLRVERIREGVKVPHMGWNQIRDLKGPLFKNIRENDYMYYVHGYRVPDSQYTIGKTDYGCEFSAAVMKNNFYGCQFHPEKSGPSGQIILQNFLEI